MLYGCSRVERQKLYNYWKDNFVQDLKDRIKDWMVKHEHIREKLQSHQEAIDAEALRHAKIVGMTTTGVAMHQKLLQSLGPKVCQTSCLRFSAIVEGYKFRGLV